MSNRAEEIPAAGPPANLVVALRSIIERLDLSALFPEPRPLEVELGCGDGSFLVNYAQRHPERNFIGVERLLGRIRKLDRKGRRVGLVNLRGVRIESAYFLEYLLPPHGATALHIYFPDPWPKRKHWKHRLVNERFPELARQALAPGGMVYLRTDDRNYFEQMTAVFAAARTFTPVETPAELCGVPTDFEGDFLKRGVQTLRAAYQLKQAGPSRTDAAPVSAAQAGRLTVSNVDDRPAARTGIGRTRPATDFDSCAAAAGQ